MKILITGTHFTPAQAVIEELKKDKNLDIVYVGRKYTQEGDRSISQESQILPKIGVKFVPIITGRLQRLFTRYTIPSILKIFIGVVQSLYIVIREQPDIVLSFGGYVAVPTVISAWFLSIPIIIHEQTLVSGLSNTISSAFASEILVSFPDNKSFDPDKTVLTGNPLRRDLFSSVKNSNFVEIINLAKVEKLPLVLITGGNQGSHIINQTVYNCLEDLNKIACVIHQTGDSKFNDYGKLNGKRNSLIHPQRYVAVKWIDGLDMGFIFKNADLAISRAGINTLLESAYFGIPTLVIPITYLYKNEQMVNAKYFESMGLTKILPQLKLTPQALVININEMVRNLPKLKERAKKANNVVIPDAAKRIALETILLVKKTR